MMYRFRKILSAFLIVLVIHSTRLSHAQENESENSLDRAMAFLEWHATRYGSLYAYGFGGATSVAGVYLFGKARNFRKLGFEEYGTIRTQLKYLPLHEPSIERTQSQFIRQLFMRSGFNDTAPTFFSDLIGMYQGIPIDKLGLKDIPGYIPGIREQILVFNDDLQKIRNTIATRYDHLYPDSKNSFKVSYAKFLTLVDDSYKRTLSSDELNWISKLESRVHTILGSIARKANHGAIDIPEARAFTLNNGFRLMDADYKFALEKYVITNKNFSRDASERILSGSKNITNNESMKFMTIDEFNKMNEKNKYYNDMFKKSLRTTKVAMKVLVVGVTLLAAGIVIVVLNHDDATRKLIEMNVSNMDNSQIRDLLADDVQGIQNILTAAKEWKN